MSNTMEGDFTREIIAYVDTHWHILNPVLYGRGTAPRTSLDPQAKRRKALVAACLFVCSTGIKWNDLPKSFPHPKTCNRYLVTWRRTHQWMNLLRVVSDDLYREIGIHIIPPRRSSQRSAYRELAHQERPDRHDGLTLLQLANLLRSGVNDSAAWKIMLFHSPAGPMPRKRQRKP